MSCMKAQRLCDTLASHENKKKSRKFSQKMKQKTVGFEKLFIHVNNVFHCWRYIQQNIRQCLGDDVNDINWKLQYRFTKQVEIGSSMMQ